MTPVSIRTPPTCLRTGGISGVRGRGQLCPNKEEFDNRVVLGHRFNSEVILLAVDMPNFLDAPMMEPSGRAVWYSFGTLMSEAAARYSGDRSR